MIMDQRPLHCISISVEVNYLWAETKGNGKNCVWLRLWILFCALRYHRNERELGSPLQLSNSPTTLLWPAHLKQLNTCHEVGVTLGRTCSYTPTPHTREGIGLTEHEALPTILLHAQKGWSHEQFSKKSYPSWTTWVVWTRAWARLYVFFKFPAFGNMNQFRFHWAIKPRSL